MKLYTMICRLEKTLELLKGEEYYAAQDDLKDLLGVILPQLHLLTKRQLLYVLTLCSRHRPTAPHTTLMYCGDAYAEITK